jgi:hypothetical protein
MKSKVSKKPAAPKAVRYGIFVGANPERVIIRSAVLPKSYATLKAAQAAIDIDGLHVIPYTAKPLKAGQR